MDRDLYWAGSDPVSPPLQGECLSLWRWAPRALPWAIAFHAVGVKSRKLMSEPSTYIPLVFSVGEDDGENATINASRLEIIVFSKI